MKEESLYGNSNVSNYIRQIWFLPFIYFIYCIRTIKDIVNHSIKTKYTWTDIGLQLSYTLIGILTINFYVYVGIEFEFFHFDLNKIVNELYFIPFYLKNFSILLIFSLILYFAFILKIGIKNSNFKSILILNIKLFNIFMPIVFSLLIITFDFSLYFISIKKNDYFLATIVSFLFLGGGVLLILYVILFFKARRFSLDIFKKRFMAYMTLIGTIILTVLTYIMLSDTLMNNIGVKGLIHKYEFCDEASSFILYKNGLKPKKDYNLYEHRKEIIACQEMFELSESKIIKKVEELKSDKE